MYNWKLKKKEAEEKKHVQHKENREDEKQSAKEEEINNDQQVINQEVNGRDEDNENGIKYSRPEPYYGYLHDKYVQMADTTGKNSKEANKKKTNTKEENGNMNMTAGSFKDKKTFEVKIKCI